MVAQCSYVKGAWYLLALRAYLSPYRRALRTCQMSETGGSIADHEAGGLDSVQLLQILIYATWNIWKERCRRMFDNKALHVDLLVMLIPPDACMQSQLTSTSTKQALQMYMGVVNFIPVLFSFIFSI